MKTRLRTASLVTLCRDHRDGIRDGEGRGGDVHEGGEVGGGDVHDIDEGGGGEGQVSQSWGQCQLQFLIVRGR